MPNQYQQVGDGISHIGHVAQQIALGLAQQKAQQRAMQQQLMLKQQELAMQAALDRQKMELMQAQGGQARSAAGLSDARAGQVQATDRSKQMLQDALWQSGMVQAGQNQGIDMGPRGDIAIARAMQAMGGLPAAAFNPENMAQMLQMSNPRAQQLMATRTKATANVSPGATLVDQYSGLPLYESPRTLGQGQVLRTNEPGQQGLEKTFPPQNYQQMLGSLANIRGQSMEMGEAVDPNDPTYKITTEAIRTLIPQLLNQATNGGPRIGLQTGQPQVQVPQTQMVSPKDKAALANQLSQQNPTWTREQVLQAVKQQLGE